MDTIRIINKPFIFRSKIFLLQKKQNINKNLVKIMIFSSKQAWSKNFLVKLYYFLTH